MRASSRNSGSTACCRSRCRSCPSARHQWSHALAVVAGVGNVLVIGLVTMAQRDLKQMVGYSSVMHMGYAFLGIAAGSVLGAGGVVMLMVAHGLSVALLFLLSTSVYQRTHTFDMDQMGGLAQKAPVLAGLFVAATFASIGLPGFANFWGELPIFVALWNFSHALTVVALTGTVVSAVYGLRAAARVFFGPPVRGLRAGGRRGSALPTSRGARGSRRSCSWRRCSSSASGPGRSRPGSTGRSRPRRRPWWPAGRRTRDAPESTWIFPH